MPTKCTERLHWTRADVFRFIRPNFFVFTSLQVFLGVTSVSRNPAWGTLLILLVVAAAFHVFAYVQNDVLDLRVDRTNPLRANDPLVTGQISPAAAFYLALLQIPLTLLATLWAGGGLWAYVALAIGFAFMTIYNVFGKRCALPMLTDAIQGLAWGTLAIYGALVAAGHINALTLVAASFGFGFLFLINGVHGGLRDLENDVAMGCRTTASFFGAHVSDGDVVCTKAVRAYAFFALAVYLGPATVALLKGLFPYHGLTLQLVFGSWTVVNFASIWVLYLMTEPSIEQRTLIIRYHGLPLLLAALIVFLPMMGVSLIITLLLCYYVPLLVFENLNFEWLRWFVDTWRAR